MEALASRLRGNDEFPAVCYRFVPVPIGEPPLERQFESVRMFDFPDRFHLLVNGVTIMSSRKLSRDQKRKAKLTERSKKSREREVFQPYSGTRYHSDAWVPVVFATEKSIHDVIVESKRSVTNSHVKQALLLLIEHLHRGGPAVLGDGEPEVLFTSSAIPERVFFKIRQAWSSLADSGRVVVSADLIGILRTLLFSLEAHAFKTGESRGYVAFLEEFIPKFGVGAGVRTGYPASELIEIFDREFGGLKVDDDDDDDESTLQSVDDPKFGK